MPEAAAAAGSAGSTAAGAAAGADSQQGQGHSRTHLVVQFLASGLEQHVRNCSQEEQQ